MNLPVKQGVLSLHLSPQNIGDIFELSDTGKRLRIDGVTDRFVHYSTEAGEKYCTSERSIPGKKLTDAAAIAAFEKNAELGRLLQAAESRALRTILDGRHSSEEQAEAKDVLSHVKAQQRHLEAHISHPRTATVQRSGGLLDKIQNAELRRVQPCSGAVQKSMDLTK